MKGFNAAFLGLYHLSYSDCCTCRLPSDPRGTRYAADIELQLPPLSKFARTTSTLARTKAGNAPLSWWDAFIGSSARGTSSRFELTLPVFPRAQFWHYSIRRHPLLYSTTHPWVSDHQKFCCLPVSIGYSCKVGWAIYQRRQYGDYIHHNPWYESSASAF